MLRNALLKTSPRALVCVRPSLVSLARRSFSSAWVPPLKRQSSTARQRRPLVNGKPVAFHISDLNNLNHQQEPEIPVYDDCQKPQFDSDLIVVLDMDECLLHSQFLSNAAVAQVYAHQLQRRQQARSNSTTSDATASSAVDSFRVTLPDGDLVHVHLRPGVHDFLQQICTRYETHIFTAALPIYANPVLDKLDPDGTLFGNRRWFRDSCTFDPPPHGSGAYVKNLSRLPATRDNLDRVVLVDNNPLSFLANPHNGILVNSFYDDPTDQTLAAVSQLIRDLEEHKDVRPVLGPRFALEESLQHVARSDMNQVQAA